MILVRRWTPSYKRWLELVEHGREKRRRKGFARVNVIDINCLQGIESTKGTKAPSETEAEKGGMSARESNHSFPSIRRRSDARGGWETTKIVEERRKMHSRYKLANKRYKFTKWETRMKIRLQTAHESCWFSVSRTWRILCTSSYAPEQWTWSSYRWRQKVRNKYAR